MPPFLVLALPRSRTKWIASFLSHGGWNCGHDEILRMRNLEDVQTWFTQPRIGSVETAVAQFWRLFPKDARIVTVRRPVTDVLVSVMRAVPDCDPLAMLRLLWAEDRKLDQIEKRIPGVVSVRFDDLTQEAVCASLFEHCLGEPHDPAWWATWDALQVSGNIPAQVKYCQAYLPQLQKLGRAAKHRILAEMAQRPVIPPDGFTFQDETFDRWYRDAIPLVEDHMAVTGQDIEDYAMKNLPLARRLDYGGAVQIMTARSNGRMFGYILALISPTLDDPRALSAQHLPFFASPDCPGLGMKLQRASIERLRAKGITEVFARAGVRGSGPRLGSMYKRLGFEDVGTMHRLNLMETV